MTLPSIHKVESTSKSSSGIALLSFCVSRTRMFAMLCLVGIMSVASLLGCTAPSSNTSAPSKEETSSQTQDTNASAPADESSVKPSLIIGTDGPKTSSIVLINGTGLEFDEVAFDAETSAGIGLIEEPLAIKTLDGQGAIWEPDLAAKIYLPNADNELFNAPDEESGVEGSNSGGSGQSQTPTISYNLVLTCSQGTYSITDVTIEELVVGIIELQDDVLRISYEDA